MSDLPNGFTGFSRRDAGFESASDAIRKAEGASRVTDARRSGGASERWAPGVAPAGGSSAARHAGFPSPYATDPGLSAWSAGSRQNPIARFLRSADAGVPGDALHFDPEKLDLISEADRRWAWVEIDLAAIRHNVMAAKSRLAHGTRLMAVVKGDAYGHGAVQCARTALNSGAEYLGVATVDEAMELRRALINAPILVLSEPPVSSVPLLLAYKIMPSVYTPEFAMSYAEAADFLGLRAPFHLKVNTGMNRIGVRHDEVVSFMRQVGFHRALELVGVFTHFATADCPETLDFGIQVKRFSEAVSSLRGAGVDTGIVHAANTAALLRYPDVHFDMVRLGIGLYGLHPSAETYATVALKPAMSVHARIVDTKLVPMSDGVSYGMHYRSPGSVKICTIPIGYADGLRRGLSGMTNILVDGMAFAQVGSICMDQCMFEVDLRSYGARRRVDPQMGDEVVVVGTSGDYAVTLDDMAQKLGTINYELAIGFGSSRMPRLYR